MKELPLITKSLDWLFPKKCVGCPQEGSWLCESCAKLILRQEMYQEEIPDVGMVTCLFDFSEPLIRELLHHLKYNGIQEIAPLLIELRQGEIGDLSKCMVLPIPTSKAKLKVRGYNQTELIAQALPRVSKDQIVRNKVIAKKGLDSQVGRNATERAVHLEHVFAWQKPVDVTDKGKPWVIVDDVWTTGATLKAMAKKLREQGICNISALVVAHSQ